MPKPTKIRMASMLLTGASLFAVGTAFAANAPADFIIAGGTVYTGADQPPTVTDVVVVGDKIAYIGPNAADRYDARTTINAKGKIVSPGFIDAHTHADDNLKSADSRIRLNEPWLYQGVATVM